MTLDKSAEVRLNLFDLEEPSTVLAESVLPCYKQMEVEEELEWDCSNVSVLNKLEQIEAPQLSHSQHIYNTEF